MGRPQRRGGDNKNPLPCRETISGRPANSQSGTIQAWNRVQS